MRSADAMNHRSRRLPESDGFYCRDCRGGRAATEAERAATATVCRAWLDRLARRRGRRLRQQEAEHRADWQDRERSEVGERALVDVGPEGTLLRRYETAASLELSRMLNQLARDRTEAPDPAPEPKAPIPAPSAPEPAGSQVGQGEPPEGPATHASSRCSWTCRSFGIWRTAPTR